VSECDRRNGRREAATPFALPDLDIQRDRFADYVGSYTDRVGISGPRWLTLTASGDLSFSFRSSMSQQIPSTPCCGPTMRDHFLLHGRKVSS